MYYGHLGVTNRCPDYQGVQVSLYNKAPFGIITYAGPLFSSVLTNRFHCILLPSVHNTYVPIGVYYALLLLLRLIHIDANRYTVQRIKFHFLMCTYVYTAIQ